MSPSDRPRTRVLPTVVGLQLRLVCCSWLIGQLDSHEAILALTTALYAGLAGQTSSHVLSVDQLITASSLLPHSLLPNPHQQHPISKPPSPHPTTNLQPNILAHQPATVANRSSTTTTIATAYHHHHFTTQLPHPSSSPPPKKNPVILSIHLITLAQLPPALSIESRSGLLTYYYDWSDRELRKAFHQLLHHHSIHSSPSATIKPTCCTSMQSTDSSRPSSPANSHTPSPPLTRPTLNLTPAEPVLSRPNLPRSASAIEPFSSSSLLHPPFSPHHHIRRRLASSLADDSKPTPSRTPPPFLIHHQRSKSAQPSLAIISPISIALSCPHSDSAEALLQRALDEDQDARSWSDPDPDPDHLLIDLPDSVPPLPPATIHPHHHPHHHPHGFANLRMDPLLADLEAKSRLNVQTECAICQKKGINYPRCPKCQLEFCSRSCRVSMGDGERHKCA